MKSIRAMKIVVRRRKMVDLIYLLIGAPNAFLHYLHGLEKYNILATFRGSKMLLAVCWAQKEHLCCMLCTIIGLENCYKPIRTRYNWFRPVT